MRTVLMLVSALIFLFLGVPCLFFGILGVQGRLADVSEAENMQIGLVCLGYGMLATAPAAICVFLLLRPRERSQPTQPQPPEEAAEPPPYASSDCSETPPSERSK